MPGCRTDREDLPHALVMCEWNGGVGVRIMACLRKFVPNLDVSTALRLELEVDEEMQLPLGGLVGTVCQAIWKLRIENPESNYMK